MQLLNSVNATSWATKYKTQKYTYLQLNDQALVAILRGMFGNLTSFVPVPTSSLIIEFSSNNIAATSFDRSNYNISLSLDEQSLIPSLTQAGIACGTTSCSWSQVAKLLEAR